MSASLREIVALSAELQRPHTLEETLVLVVKRAARVIDVAQASMVPCHANLLQALRGEAEAETTGEDNLKTVRLVFGAYDSAAKNEVVRCG